MPTTNVLSSPRRQMGLFAFPTLLSDRVEPASPRLSPIFLALEKRRGYFFPEVTCFLTFLILT
jgi:hypothetical protein